MDPKSFESASGELMEAPRAFCSLDGLPVVPGINLFLKGHNFGASLPEMSTEHYLREKDVTGLRARSRKFSRSAYARTVNKFQDCFARAVRVLGANTSAKASRMGLCTACEQLVNNS